MVRCMRDQLSGQMSQPLRNMPEMADPDGDDHAFRCKHLASGGLQLLAVRRTVQREHLVGLCQIGARGRPVRRSHRGAGRWHTGQAPAQQASRTCSWSSSCHKVRPTPPVLGVAVAPG